MFQNIGLTEILLIGLVGLLLFGPKKLPELGRAFGKTLQEFKKGARELMSDEPALPSAPSAPAASVESASAPASDGAAKAALHKEGEPILTSGSKRLPD